MNNRPVSSPVLIQGKELQWLDLVVAEMHKAREVKEQGSLFTEESAVISSVADGCIAELLPSFNKCLAFRFKSQLRLQTCLGIRG